MKESYIKCRGSGLSIPLDSFTVRVKPDGKVSAQSAEQRAAVQLPALCAGSRLQAGSLCARAGIAGKMEILSVRHLLEELLR